MNAGKTGKAGKADIKCDMTPQRKEIQPENIVPIIPADPSMMMLSGESGARHERSDAAENRRRILDVAAQLFTEHGVEGICMQQIARAAGVGQGTLYRRFADKGELCLALLNSQMSDFQNEVLSTLREMAHHSRGQLEQLEWFFDALVHFNERHSPLLSAARSEMRGIDHDNLTPRSAPFAWIRMTVIGLLTGGVRTGELRADVDAAVLADVLLGALNPQQFYVLRHGPNAYSLERISAGLKRLVRGLSSCP